MSDCIFCKIIEGVIPSTKVYENDYVLAFLDIAPVNPGHALVVSKKHYSNLEEIPELELTELIKAVKIIGQAIKSGLNVDGYNVTENNDPIAGQIIPHIHFHIIPRIKGDNLQQWPQVKYEEGQADEVAEKIKKAL